VSLGVGGTFDILAGKYSMAPTWVTRLCMEWAYRLTQEPGRLWKRYLITNTKFVLLVLRALVFQRLFLRRT
jgi:N-acetylglucosaminyldiphosphoundecaprenol N-acetyl-beta-D-mannosaminyltransferase